jgi:imidazole glycerol-phosphate synthase subunit HisF
MAAAASMIETRVIPSLLLLDGGLVKTVQFQDPNYLGDPVNIARLFNDKQVDELVLLDIGATVEGRAPSLETLQEMASECFMPLAYGGGIRTADEGKRILEVGVEKVIVNTAAVYNPRLVGALAAFAGSSSVVASLDVGTTGRGYEVFTHGGRRATGRSPLECAIAMENEGAGELLLTSIDRDGTMDGYDLALIAEVTSGVGIPVVACGGARDLSDLVRAVEAGASAAAAGSMFVYQGRHRAVLITYPSREELRVAFPT